MSALLSSHHKTWKGEIVPVHTIKAYGGSRGISPHILIVGTRWTFVINFTPRPFYAPPPVSNKYEEAWWATMLVWMFWKSDIYLASVGNRAVDLPARSVVTTLSKLPSSCFHISTYYFFSLLGVALCITFRFFRWRLATRYGLEGPGTESRQGRDFPHLSRPAPRPTQPPVQWVPGPSRE